MKWISCFYNFPLCSFSEYRVSILETAKVLVDDTKKLVSSAGGTQEMLAEAATNAIKTITKEAEHVKLGAAALGSDDMEAQVSKIPKFYGK